MVARILCAAGDLDRRVADFLEISRLESGGGPDLRTEACSVRDLVTSAVDRLQLSLADHVVRVDVDARIRALVDDGATGRVLENLLGNAAKYAPPGTTVTVSAVTEGDLVVLAVADQGPGIDAQDRDRVFDRFVRLGERSKVRGAGISLSVVRQLVEAQGGTVAVESGVGVGIGVGSTFVVRLPAAAPVPAMVVPVGVLT